jgi:diguanylate cyclase (GGDEF)-like protein/PAS domain S-box-containing protein
MASSKRSPGPRPPQPDRQTTLTPKNSSPESNQFLGEFMDELNPAIFAGLLTVDGKIEHVNRAALDAVGVEFEDVIGMAFAESPWVSFSKVYQHRVTQAIQSAGIGKSSRFEKPVRDKNGQTRTMDFSLSPLLGRDEKITWLVASSFDVTERKIAERVLRRTQFGIDHVPAMVFQTAADGRLSYANNTACNLLGYSRETLLRLSIFDLDLHVSQPCFEAWWAALKSKGSIRFESVYRHADGRPIPVEGTVNYLDYAGDQFSFVYVQDITERRAAQAQIDYMAHYDALTGLPNRALLLDRVIQAIHLAHYHHLSLTVLSIGLDRFKLINDTLGAARGDDVLRIAGKRISACVRPIDTAARTGSDEFFVVLSCDPMLPHDGIAHDESRLQVAQAILDIFDRPMNVAGQELFVHCSIGIADYPADGADTDELMKNAYAAQQQAKLLGGSRMQAYSSGSRSGDTERLHLEMALRNAPERSELIVYYQPKVELASGKIVGAEALLRWQIPHREMVPPGRFIPIAEETGMILSIGEWVLQTACIRLNSWKRQGLPISDIAVNLSARQFGDKQLVRNVARALEAAQLDPQCLELELTESTLMADAESAIRTMFALKDLGLRISLDDFGTGYSSLSYLRQFPINAVKIDQSFVRDIDSDQNSAAIAEGVIAMAHRLKLSVTAEGVETVAQLDILRDSGCDLAQGYLFSKPIPAEEFMHLLKNTPTDEISAAEGRGRRH